MLDAYYEKHDLQAGEITQVIHENYALIVKGIDESVIVGKVFFDTYVPKVGDFYVLEASGKHSVRSSQYIESLYKCTDEDELTEKLFNLNGVKTQAFKCIEELCELKSALSNYIEGSMAIQDSADAVITELADVQITINQMKHFFGKDEVEQEIQVKLARTKERLGL